MRRRWSDLKRWRFERIAGSGQQEAESRLPCECGGPCHRVKVGRYDLAGFVGLPAGLRDVPALRCGECGRIALEGAVTSAALLALTQQVLMLPRILTPAEAKYLRKSLQLSQKDLAERMGVIRETVAAWEHGQKVLSPLQDTILRDLYVGTPAMSDEYACEVTWSEEDGEFVGLCAEFPSLSWLAKNPQDALDGITRLVSDVVADMRSGGEALPDSARVWFTPLHENTDDHARVAGPRGDTGPSEKRSPKRRSPTKPGEILEQEFLRPLGITQSELAERMGVPEEQVRSVVSGESAVTAETAIRLAGVLRTSPDFWMNLQANLDFQGAEEAPDEVDEERRGATTVMFTPTPHRNAAVHRQVMEEVRTMTKEQFVASTVEAGIYTADGQLTVPYWSDDPPPSRGDGHEV